MNLDNYSKATLREALKVLRAVEKDDGYLLATNKRNRPATVKGILRLVISHSASERVSRKKLPLLKAEIEKRVKVTDDTLSLAGAFVAHFLLWIKGSDVPVPIRARHGNYLIEANYIRDNWVVKLYRDDQLMKAANASISTYFYAATDELYYNEYLMVCDQIDALIPEDEYESE